MFVNLSVNVTEALQSLHTYLMTIKQNKISGFSKKCFFPGLAFLSILTSVNSLSAAPLNAVPLNCILINNQECKVRLHLVNFDGDESVFFPFSIKLSKCSGTYNNINNPYAKLIMHMQCEELMKQDT